VLNRDVKYMLVLSNVSLDEWSVLNRDVKYMLVLPTVSLDEWSDCLHVCLIIFYWELGCHFGRK